MSDPRVVVLLDCVGDAGALFERALTEAGVTASVDLVPDAKTLDAADLQARIEGAAALVTPLTVRVDAALLDAAGPSLRVVANYAVGYDNIDLAACGARGVTVCNGPPPMTEPTADIAWALLLGAARRVREGLDHARSGRWTGYDAQLLLGHRLVGGTLLIVGAGRIGAAVARRSLGWDMRVLYTARTPKPGIEAAPINAVRTTLEDGLAEADAVVVTTAFTPETRHLIDAPALERMKPSAVLVNVSRGPVVDEQALADALADGTIFAAGLDVYEREPTIHPSLVNLPNALLLPHLGSSTVEDRTDLTVLCAENVAAVLSGRTPPFQVTTG
jgi:glyoxylate reductase